MRPAARADVHTRYLAKELAPRRIAVNTVPPGAIASDFSGGMVRDNPEINKRVADMTALGRAGLPDDIGPMIASLLSEDNRWVNAQSQQEASKPTPSAHGDMRASYGVALMTVDCRANKRQAPFSKRKTSVKRQSRFFAPCN